MRDTTKAREYEAGFQKAMEKWMNGEWYIPEWWEDVRAKKSFEQHLIRLGFVKK